MIIGVAMAEIGRGEEEEEEWVAVPGGYRHRDCVSFLPSGSHIAKEGEGYRVKHPSGYEEYKECSHKAALEGGARVHGRAWKTWAQYHNTTAFTSMSAQWAVPSSPTTQRNQILYFWPGTEPDDNSFVIQPVVFIPLFFPLFYYTLLLQHLFINYDYYADLSIHFIITIIIIIQPSSLLGFLHVIITMKNSYNGGKHQQAVLTIGLSQGYYLLLDHMVFIIIVLISHDFYYKLIEAFIIN